MSEKYVLTLFDGRGSYGACLEDLGHQVVNYTTSVEPANEWSKDDHIDMFLSGAKALMLTGGDDINPVLYGDKPIKNARWDEQRDSLEVKVTLKALNSRNLPDP
jgi:Predicted glutamine amidotransferases